MSCVAYSQPHVKLQFVNDQKFACESCIKGHRSSSCQHTDRPLFEIKKKGRPVSQCGKCRELRKTKRMHNKCNCASGSLAETPAQIPQVAASSSSKSRRFKPIAPALPNGLKSLPSELSQTLYTTDLLSSTSKHFELVWLRCPGLSLPSGGYASVWC
ncbi:hypothetical protein EVJ58_g6606 [Rhodofomes roseus]|uniref:Copper-fist domain-containing protein n=1 Tax=Rhodofomes roseus TaxID=34475 RepID=A0A4Y9Y6I1_9APHY|nr:hypothetical protein EVJ58_g6606 [Rhodofomes roseus]